MESGKTHPSGDGSAAPARGSYLHVTAEALPGLRSRDQLVPASQSEVEKEEGANLQACSFFSFF